MHIDIILYIYINNICTCIYIIYIYIYIYIYVRQPHQTSDMLTNFKMIFFAYLKTLMT